ARRWAVGSRVGGDGGGGWAVGGPPLLATDLGQRHAVAAQLLRHGHLQIAGIAELLEVFREEAVLAIIPRRTIAAPGDELVGESESVPCGRHRETSMCMRVGVGKGHRATTPSRASKIGCILCLSSRIRVKSVSRSSRSAPLVFALGCREEDMR